MRRISGTNLEILRGKKIYKKLYRVAAEEQYIMIHEVIRYVVVLCLHYVVLVLQLTDDTVILAVAKAKRDDTGKYTVTLKNPSGVETSTVNVNVLGELTDFFLSFYGQVSVSYCSLQTSETEQGPRCSGRINTQGKYTCPRHTS